MGFSHSKLTCTARKFSLVLKYLVLTSMFTQLQPCLVRVVCKGVGSPLLTAFCLFFYFSRLLIQLHPNDLSSDSKATRPWRSCRMLHQLQLSIRLQSHWDTNLTFSCSYSVQPCVIPAHKKPKQRHPRSDKSKRKSDKTAMFTKESHITCRLRLGFLNCVYPLQNVISGGVVN